MAKVSNKVAAATKKTSGKQMIKEIDATKLSRKATKAATKDFEKLSKAHTQKINDIEDLKLEHNKKGLSFWFDQGETFIQWKVDWIAAGGDPKVKGSNSWKTYIDAQTCVSENDRGEAVWVVQNWSKVSSLDLTENDLSKFSVSAIKKRIKNALETPAQRREKEEKKTKREAAQAAAQEKAQKDAADLKAFKAGKHPSQSGTINIADLMKDPTKFGSIIGAMVNKTYDDKGKGQFVAAAGKKIVIKTK